MPQVSLSRRRHGFDSRTERQTALMQSALVWHWNSAKRSLTTTDTLSALQRPLSSERSELCRGQQPPSRAVEYRNYDRIGRKLENVYIEAESLPTSSHRNKCAIGKQNTDWCHAMAGPSRETVDQRRITVTATLIGIATKSESMSLFISKRKQ